MKSILPSLARVPTLVFVLMFLIMNLVSDPAHAVEPEYRFSYYANGRICVDTLGKLDGNDPIMSPPRSDWQDFKPSWSKTGDMLVFFRRIKDDPAVVNWKTILCIAKADGTGLQKLTDDKHTNFNPTWTRDGKNSPIWNRKHSKGHFIIMRSEIGNGPEECVALTDPNFQNWAHSCLIDGRILVESYHPTKGFGYYLMTPRENGKPEYKRIDDGGMLAKGLMMRISISPDEKKVCFEHMLGYKFKEPGHAIYIADFDAENLKMANHKPIANKTYGAGWYAYPRWTKDGNAVIYHANTTGRGRLFLYQLEDGKTRKVSRDDTVDFRYPHVEDTPK